MGNPGLDEKARVLKREAVELRPGRPAPPFEIGTVDGRRVSRNDFGSQSVALLFWSANCTPSQIVRKSLAVSRPADLQFVSLLLGAPSDDEPVNLGEGAVEAAALRGFQDPVARAFNVTATPTLVLMDPSGRISGKFHSLPQMLDRLDAKSSVQVEAFQGQTETEADKTDRNVSEMKSLLK